VCCHQSSDRCQAGGAVKTPREALAAGKAEAVASGFDLTVPYGKKYPARDGIANALPSVKKR